MITKLFKIPIYGGKLKVYFVESWDYINKKYNDNLTDIYCASVLTNHTDQTEYVIAFRGKIDIKTIVHESVHLVNLIFKDRGIKLDLDNDEAQAYFTDWIFDKIYSLLK